MRPKLRSLLAISLVAAAVGGFAITRGSDVSSQTIRDSIRACAPTLGVDKVWVEPEEEDCMVERVYQFYRNGNAEELWEALRLQSRDLPDFYYPCHSILHRVGERAYDEFQDMADLIVSNNSDVCGSAFVMGGLDAFGADTPDKDEFTAVARACESMSGPGKAARLRGMCEHSSGHAAWKSTLSIPMAASLCNIFLTESGQTNCGDGVIMQIYQPANGEATRPVDDARTEMNDLCADWPDLGWTRLGCYAGAGYIYSRPLFSYDALVRGQNGDNHTLTSEQRDKLRALLLDVVSLCRSHAWEPGVDACLERSSQDIPTSFYWDDALTEELCAEFGRHRDRCLVHDDGF